MNKGGCDERTDSNTDSLFGVGLVLVNASMIEKIANKSMSEVR